MTRVRKFLKVCPWIILFLPLFANAAYQRNVAKPVNEVVYGKIDSVRYITQQEVVQSKSNGWKTLLGATIGGLVGNQFGGGTGKEVATAVGALAGAAVAQNQSNYQYTVEYKLVELLIKVKGDKLINVIQDVDKNMLFSRGDEVRILYFDDGVRVDLAY
ncbi:MULTISPECIES: outer membrane lipoprotein [Vibrio]|jgi:outer membrane lipoprotein SlyB|uniref:Glycine zipper 2TM domain-containing protein n=4 Tax=Vibrio TaxID=662 RepID=A0A7H5CZD2_VIBPH|nr:MULTISPECIES: glycine zipper 2TM domain-containing protein [Vibrio]EJG0763055.1 glycine zipper 2TM domain-containing protein [Vibrio parahaemolyticus O5:K30]EJG0920715.1 glycine zipper 2TM domain-containing protein [Vibrio parahaemolyticus O1:K68]EJG0930330.1 glycine zipper 2TM domain-containing protein [Vibrio parahaemolyticus O1]EJG0944542.1 glycine zipper 2TM domain-containing protein [Vibrio parahaemolyticus O10]EJG0948246.1 glycine zipper 2TM domain-containing protein [Vibrio parahaemo